jgi:hypothetical protein
MLRSLSVLALFLTMKLLSMCLCCVRCGGFSLSYVTVLLSVRAPDAVWIEGNLLAR